MTTKQQIIEESVKEFKIGWDNTSDGSKADMVRKDFAVTYLRQSLSQAMDATEEALRGEKKECPNHGNSIDDNFEQGECYGYDETYNSALTDIEAKSKKFNGKE